MKKKFILVLALLVLTALVAVPALAASDPATDAKAWFDQRFAAKKAAVDQAVKDGKITSEQAGAWQEHLDQMYQLRQEEGFVCPNGTPGAGMGQGMRQGMRQGMGIGQGQAKGLGFGTGMGMNRWGGQTPAAPAQ